MTREALLAGTREITLRAAREVRRSFLSKDFEVTSKGRAGPLSSADLAANDILTRGLAALDPSSALLSEETKDTPERVLRSAVWIIDPIDGTREFVNGVPEFSISVGRSEEGEAVLGAVALPAVNSIVFGAAGLGIVVEDFETGERRPSSGLSRRNDLEGAKILVSASEHKRGYTEALARKFELAPSGSIARKLALLAAGEGDLVVSLCPKNDWDICGGTALVRAADGVVRDLEFGRSRTYNTSETLSYGLVAGPIHLVDAFLAWFWESGIPVRRSYS